MQAEAIPIIATPVMHHRTVSIKNSEPTSTNCNNDVFESSSSSDKGLRYTTRLKVMLNDKWLKSWRLRSMEYKPGISNISNLFEGSKA